MKGIIFYKDSDEKANEKLEEIIHNYELLNYSIIQYKKNRMNNMVEFSNGDFWQTKKANKNSRGCACNIAYIEKGIEKEIIDIIIIPSIKAMPYTGFNFW